MTDKWTNRHTDRQILAILATVTTSASFELASSHARVTSIKSTKQESVSESNSQPVS